MFIKVVSMQLDKARHQVITVQVLRTGQVRRTVRDIGNHPVFDLHGTVNDIMGQNDFGIGKDLFSHWPQL